MFFFKHKTAYEMRISDVSSDVCASDLANVDELSLLPHAEVLETAIAAVLDGRAENDAFNELVLTNQTDPRAIVWLRAWFRYLRQGGSAYGMDTVVSALRHAPALTAALIERFRALHDPKARDAKQIGRAHV